MRVFGDSISTTASNPGAGSLYYGQRYSNGRVWVEVLAQMQGISYDPAKNTDSFFGNTSDKMWNEVKAYVPPADASNVLVVIWVNNADMYYPALDPSPTLSKFNAVINVALTNQFKAITNLYAKGIRTLVMPNVVDISTVPQFNGYVLYKSLFRQASINYNTGFMSMLDKAKAACPGLTVVAPDYFSLLNNLLARPADFGVLNAVYDLLSVDALDDPLLLDKNLNGPGANYIFWDPTDPTAKVHYIMASMAQQMVSPVKIGGLTQINGSNRLDLVNLPIGVNGTLETCTNLAGATWSTVTGFSCTNLAQPLYVVTPPLPADFGDGLIGSSGTSSGGPPTPGSGGSSTSTNSIPFKSALQVYRLKLTPSWNWP